MPTYEYECQKCGHRFEEFQSMKDAALTKCPKCKGKLKRLVGAGAGFLFKGSGFYTTDYARKTTTAGSGDGKTSSDSKSESKSSKGDKKPASTSSGKDD